MRFKPVLLKGQLSTCGDAAKGADRTGLKTRPSVYKDSVNCHGRKKVALVQQMDRNVAVKHHELTMCSPDQVNKQ